MSNHSITTVKSQQYQIARLYQLLIYFFFFLILFFKTYIINEFITIFGERNINLKIYSK